MTCICIAVGKLVSFFFFLLFCSLVVEGKVDELSCTCLCVLPQEHLIPYILMHKRLNYFG